MGVERWRWGGCVVREGFLEELGFNFQGWVECRRAGEEGSLGERSVRWEQLSPYPPEG